MPTGEPEAGRLSDSGGDTPHRHDHNQLHPHQLDDSEKNRSLLPSESSDTKENLTRAEGQEPEQPGVLSSESKSSEIQRVYAIQERETGSASHETGEIDQNEQTVLGIGIQQVSESTGGTSGSIRQMILNPSSSSTPSPSFPITSSSGSLQSSGRPISNEPDADGLSAPNLTGSSTTLTFHSLFSDIVATSYDSLTRTNGLGISFNHDHDHDHYQGNDHDIFVNPFKSVQDQVYGIDRQLQDADQAQKQVQAHNVDPNPAQQSPVCSSSARPDPNPPSTIPTKSAEPFCVPRELPLRPLIDLPNHCRMPSSSKGKGCLQSGSIFRGQQTSGRSSYDVEVRMLDVNIHASTVCGYLSISQLTDSHPKLTTFFSGEIIGSQYGFRTDSDNYAETTEADDMSHWSRFEQFRKIRSELKRPGLMLRDTVPNIEQDRNFVFMRWKENFLVPDHKIKDITGASFAGFYYICLGFDSPSGSKEDKPNNVRGSSNQSGRRCSNTGAGSRPSTGRRPSSQSGTARGGPTSPTVGTARNGAQDMNGATVASPTGTNKSPPKRTTSNEKAEKGKSGVVPLKEGAVLTGYYFHHQNSEPFQELNLRHVPQRGSGSMELR